MTEGRRMARNRTGNGRTGQDRGMIRPAAVSVFLGVAGIAAGMTLPALAQNYSFSDVRIEGNDRVDATTILGFARINRGQAISAGELNEAYQRLADSGLFETVEIVPQGGTLVIRVQEFPTINIINFEGNARIKDDKLAGLVKSQSRRAYNPAQAEADAAAITEAYRVQGRIAATVTPKIIRRSDNRVDLVFDIAEGKVVEIERLSFVGNRAYSDRRLRQVLETKQAGLLRSIIASDTFIAERVELDKQLLRDFYLSRGFIDFEVLDATAEVTRERDAFFMTFTVQEGQSYSFGQITASSEVEGIDAADFQQALRIRRGVTYSPSVVENNIARLESLALQKGLNFVRIEPRITRNERNQTLDVNFALVRGERIFVERIDIEGNTTTLDQVVRRQFRTVEGDPFNPREVRQSAERIRALGYFANADVNTRPGSSPDQVVVDVNVEEQPTGSLSFGVSYGVSSGVGFSIGFSEQNFLGRGQILGVDVSTGTDNVNTQLNFVEPSFLGRDLRFRFNAYYRETDNQYSRYDTRKIGISPSIEFPVSDSGRLELRYTLSEDKISNVDGGPNDTDDDDDVSSIILINEEARGALIASSVGYTYSWDSNRGGLNPTGRNLLRFSQDFAGVGGDVEYVSTTALAMAERKVWNEEVTVRAIIEGGALSMIGDDPSRVTDRFFGNGKIRGFEPNGIGPRDLNVSNEDALGGNYFAVARLEADFPLGLPEEYGFSGGVFADAGSVWSLDDVGGGTTGDDTVDDDFHIRSSVGVSLFWTTPIGPLRFNFAKAIEKQDYDKEQFFDLTISTRF
ncbi:outer membrane protein assembly factor BamA [Cereibacter sphaeroides]|uniref:Outer membrane protein assembly factor BamA n=2 Tax=Cereibacter sphaeroides TaxID=1063 RepID=A0AAX1UFV9_CERSP|nr:outer membrane protein assembly factor BamA [Cereibacter sphaeroides]ABN76479.1 surface antigen (D15) [Cereibacter sphaeroides ATCC 17029]AZB55500.1 outer membrane protein assembly factor BamA [Cereibacter sphaeroides]AZB59757.1 outer membrane protein assembly factor BamA [Cereibacter sphaeroides]AZB63940.1 outer membrane protein assembly factor BamA [Cereibacter sphaeroides]AZB68137.1 outer membrane protein assembly factor BamA [Cereibacter sphaeroides]